MDGGEKEGAVGDGDGAGEGGAYEGMVGSSCKGCAVRLALRGGATLRFFEASPEDSDPAYVAVV